ncbi:hypothetical protein HJG60_007982 [Phyllostomus discolor]|uniref:Uncharacterized protein n=1 Tax=Phyllostomus discolor TaxID=89673 RepID=A0A834EVE3_9CHIR|nr:hypothetical protein HJG60_007982 [Phyllostomus discolor]
MLRASSYVATPRMRGEHLRPVSDPETKGNSGAEVKRTWKIGRRAANLDGKRRAGHYEEGRAVTRTSAAGRGSKEVPRGPSITHFPFSHWLRPHRSSYLLPFRDLARRPSVGFRWCVGPVEIQECRYQTDAPEGLGKKGADGRRVVVLFFTPAAVWQPTPRDAIGL